MQSQLTNKARECKYIQSSFAMNAGSVAEIPTLNVACDSGKGLQIQAVYFNRGFCN